MLMASMLAFTDSYCAWSCFHSCRRMSIWRLFSFCVSTPEQSTRMTVQSVMAKDLMMTLNSKFSPSKVREMHTSRLTVKMTLTESIATPRAVSESRRRVCLGARKCDSRRYIPM